MQNTRNTRLTSAIVAVGAGALLMYLFDHDRGRRRVALARDRIGRLARTGRDTADAGLRDLANRARATAAKARGVLRHERPSDDVLVERVRARLGRLVSHPRAVQVTASAGRVTLRGSLLESEEQQLLSGVQRVPGVEMVESRLEVHKTADDVPELQGGTTRSAPRMEFMQSNWAPGPRLAALAAGGALAGYGAMRRGLPGLVLGIAGGLLAARAATNTELSRLLGLSGGRRAVDLQKTIHIAAPRETVFDLWANYENFPKFMSLVEEVRPLDDARSHWVVKGPAGTRVEWDAALTERVRPEVLAWRTEPGSPVQHAGMVRFDEADSGTRVSLRMSYNPPGGALGHTIAALLGRDPKQEMDADLMRMKAFIETGIAPHDAAQPASVPPRPELQAATERQIEERVPGGAAGPDVSTL